MAYEDKSGIPGELFREPNHSERMTNFVHERMIKWTLMSSTIPMTCIIFGYLFVIYVAGPRFMKNRQPYSLKVFMQCYNVLQVFVNFWLWYNIWTTGCAFISVWRYNDSLAEVCGDNTERQFEVAWWALLIKIFDFTETVIFVLRKNQRQVSVLHVYHHISIVFLIWLALRDSFHGHVMYTMLLNSVVHMIMYSYYFLSTCGPKIQQIVSPFKKWITILQIVQLFVLVLPVLQGLGINCDPRVRYYSIRGIFVGITQILLFYNFYKKSYKKSKTA